MPGIQPCVVCHNAGSLSALNESHPAAEKKMPLKGGPDNIMEEGKEGKERGKEGKEVRK